MSIAISQPISIPHKSTVFPRSLINKFLNWSDDQEKNRIGWEGIGLVIFGCILTPLTVLAVTLSGTNTFLIISALVAMEVTLVTNLTAMPTKITIPAFILGILTDFLIIVVSVINAI